MDNTVVVAIHYFVPILLIVFASGFKWEYVSILLPVKHKVNKRRREVKRWSR